MPDDDDHEIGRQIVSAMRRKIEPAHGATIVDLQKGAEQLAFAAARATAAKPARQGRPKIAFFWRTGFAAPDFVGWIHCLHDLARFELLTTIRARRGSCCPSWPQRLRFPLSRIQSAAISARSSAVAYQVLQGGRPVLGRERTGRGEPRRRGRAGAKHLGMSSASDKPLVCDKEC